MRRGPRGLRLLAALALAAGARALPQQGAAGGAEAGGAPARYHGLEDGEALLSSWLGSGLCERLELGKSFGERRLLGVQFGGWGQVPLAERPAIVLVGGLDGLSLSGSEAVVHAVGALLAAPDRLPADVTFVALPWANPDGLERSRRRGAGDGRNDRPVDDDRDGRVDEDGPDDVDGDGLILDLLVEDPAGAWVRSTDGRFLRPAGPGEAPRYALAREGRDDDRDGRFNEDGPGGVALERNFPAGWRGPLFDPASGSWPLSEPCARALADLVLARRTAVVLLFQGNHGTLAPPPATGDPEAAAWDRQAFATLGALFARGTGRASPPEDAPSVAGPGSPIGWLYGSLGVLAVEVACWGPEVEPGERRVRDARFALEELAPDVLLAPGLRELTPEDRSWLRWLDDTRGGLGFVDWQPVDLGDGRQGLVGGWEPLTCFNPPASALGQALSGIERFALEVAGALPRLQIEVLEARRDGPACVLRARLRNAGALPAGLAAAGEASRARVELVLPDGVELLAGETQRTLPPLSGSGASEELSWLVLAPPGSVLGLRVQSALGAAVAQELRL